MFATLTSKGQLTPPEGIRDRLNLEAGAILDFQIRADNTITVRHVLPDARRIRSLLKPRTRHHRPSRKWMRLCRSTCAPSARPAGRVASRLADDWH